MYDTYRKLEEEMSKEHRDDWIKKHLDDELQLNRTLIGMEVKNPSLRSKYSQGEIVDRVGVDCETNQPKYKVRGEEIMPDLSNINLLDLTLIGGSRLLAKYDPQFQSCNELKGEKNGN